MSRKRIIIIAVIVLFSLIGYFIYAALTKNQPQESVVKQGETVNPTEKGDANNPAKAGGGATPTPAPTTEELTGTIQKSAPYLTDSSNGAPTFGIVKTEKPLDGWFIETILVKGSPQRYKIILKQTTNPNNPLTVVIGPGTYFPRQDVSLPEEVWKALGQ
jgi:hypothetical protein